MKRLAAVVLIASLVPLVWAEKKRPWQEGVLLGFETVDRGVVAGVISGVLIARRRTSLAYLIATPDMFYTLGSDARLDLTVNAKVRFAIQKDQAYVIDDAGKERKLWVMRKEARQKPEVPMHWSASVP